MQPRQWGIAALAVLAVAQISVGAWLFVGHVGEVPRYWDTVEYLRFSSSLRIPPARAPLYPYLLAGADHVRGQPRALVQADWKHPEATRDLGAVQVAQLALCAAALAYFLSALFDWRSRHEPGAKTRPMFLLMLGLLLLDPLVLHFSLSVMPDALALAASLVFCAALSDLTGRRISPWVAGLLLATSQLIAGGTRLEKNLVMLATAGVVAAACFLWERRGHGPRGLARRGFAALAISVAAFAAVQLGQAWIHGTTSASVMRDTILNQRFVHPHLTEIYDALPPRARKRINRRQAELYDESIARSRKVMLKVTRGDPKVKAELTRDFVVTALSERWPLLLADISKDFLENVFPTVSFHTRVAAARVLEPEAFHARFESGGIDWTFQRMTRHLPGPARLQLGVSLLLLAAASVATLFWWRGRSAPAAGWFVSDAAVRWAPVAAFCLANAAAFALTQNLVLVRYALFAHVMLLCVVYSGALAWARPKPASRRR